MIAIVVYCWRCTYALLTEVQSVIGDHSCVHCGHLMIVYPLSTIS